MAFLKLLFPLSSVALQLQKMPRITTTTAKGLLIVATSRTREQETKESAENGVIRLAASRNVIIIVQQV